MEYKLPTRPSPEEARGLSNHVWKLMTECWQAVPGGRPSILGVAFVVRQGASVPRIYTYTCVLAVLLFVTSIQARIDSCIGRFIIVQRHLSPSFSDERGHPPISSDAIVADLMKVMLLRSRAV